MTRREPSYCPYCGSELTRRAFEGRERGFCPDCREFVFQNPAPTGWVVVLDGDRALFVQRDHPPDRGAWTVPGGFVEVDEPAAVGAAREFREETGVRVDPGDLTLLRTGFHVEDPDDGSLLSICFGVERERTEGDVAAGAEPAAARFWAPETLSASDEATRSVDRRRVEAAFERLRGEERNFEGR